jgi:hypothetical protein
LHITPTMGWQPTPYVTSHDRIKIGQPPQLPQKIMGPGPIGRGAAAHGQVVLRSNPRGSKSQGAEQRRTTAGRSPAGSVFEPAHPETAGNTPQDLTSRIRATGLDGGSRDFSGNKQDFGKERNLPKPHAAHETSPVLGAIVVEMTNGACHGPSYLPAGVPGISMTQR